MNEIDQYISQFPMEVQKQLQRIRTIIKKAAPDAVEQIVYGMPGYKTNGKPLVYFAGYKNHIGFYATPSGHEAFQKELSKYKQGKGSAQFPLNQTIPFDLIEQIVRFRVQENAEKS
ncbi:MAG: iron chaperone [Allomuricauda sp.]